MNISGVPGGNNNNISKQNAEIQNQQVQNQQIQHQNQQIQNQNHEVKKQDQNVQNNFDFRSQFDYSSRPSYMNKGIFKKDKFPGLNKRVGFGDIIYTMAQAGKPSGACGGSFMAVA